MSNPSKKEKEVYIVRHNVTANFTTLPNSIFRDKRIGWNAMGLLVYLLHLPPNFKLKLYNLAKERAGITGSGRDGTSSAIKALESAGYVKIANSRDNRGRFKTTTWYVSDTPSSLAPIPGSDLPQTGNPDTDRPNTEKPLP